MSGSKGEIPASGKVSLPFLSNRSDFDIAIEIIETNSLEKRLDEFSSITGEAVFRYTSIAESVISDMKSEDFFIEYWRWKRAKKAFNSYRSDMARLEELKIEQNEIRLKKSQLIKEAKEFFEACTPEEKEIVNEDGGVEEMWADSEG